VQGRIDKGSVWLENYTQSEIARLSEILSFDIPGREHMPLYKQGKWDGIKRFLDWRLKKFSVGLLSYVEEKLNHKIEILSDERVFLDLPYVPVKIDGKYDFRDYQEISIKKLLKNNGGAVELATNAGKTAGIASVAASFAKIGKTTVILERTVNLLTQVKAAVESCLGYSIGQITRKKKEYNYDCIIIMVPLVTRILDRVAKDEGSDEDYEIFDILSNTDAFLVDECVAGSSLIQTEKGTIQIKDVPAIKPLFILSYDGYQSTYKRIRRFWSKGLKETLQVTFSSGEKLVCTPEHLIYTEEHGWVEAGKLQKNQTCFTGKRSFKSIMGQSKNALVVVVRKYLVNSICLPKILKDIILLKQIPRNISISMIKDLKIGLLFLHLGKNTVFSVHALATAFYVYLIQPLRIHIFAGVIVPHNYLGVDIKKTYFLDYLFMSTARQIKVIQKGARIFIRLGHAVYRHLNLYMTKCIKTIKNRLHCLGLKILKTKVLLGGFVTTDLMIKKERLFTYIQRVLRWKKIYYVKNFFLKFSDAFHWLQRKIIKIVYIHILDFYVAQLTCFLTKFYPLYQKTCTTKVLDIQKYKSVDVYDLEVEDTHCFFANNILVHNCHHAQAASDQAILNMNRQALRFGFSGSLPKPGTIADLNMREILGETLHKVSNKELIDRGISAKPTIHFIAYETSLGSKLDAYKQAIRNDCFKMQFQGYDHTGKEILKNVFSVPTYTNKVKEFVMNYAIKHNPAFTSIIKLLVDVHVAVDQSTVIIVDWKAFGADLAETIDAPLLYSKTKNREELIEDFSSGKIKKLVTTSILDEGMSINRIKVLILATAGSSRRQFLQRVGRALRVKKDGDNTAIIYDFWRLGHKYLLEPSKKRLALWKEEGFDVEMKTV